MTDRELSDLLDEKRALTDDERDAVACEGNAPRADDPLLAILATLREHGAPQPAFTARVMASLEGRRRGLTGRLRDAIVRQRTLRFNFAVAAPLGIAAAALAYLIVSGGGNEQLASTAAPEADERRPRAEPGIPVQFSLAAPAADRVYVVGDFNGWDTRAAPLSDEDGDGVWSATVEIAPGRYGYKFVIDGDDWVLDPQADAVVPDDFGGQNSVLRL